MLYVKNNELPVWEPYNEYKARIKWQEENEPFIIQQMLWTIWGKPKSLSYNIPRILTKNIQQRFVV